MTIILGADCDLKTADCFSNNRILAYLFARIMVLSSLCFESLENMQAVKRTFRGQNACKNYFLLITILGSVTCALFFISVILHQPRGAGRTSNGFLVAGTQYAVSAMNHQAEFCENLEHQRISLREDEARCETKRFQLKRGLDSRKTSILSWLGLEAAFGFLEFRTTDDQKVIERLADDTYDLVFLQGAVDLCEKDVMERKSRIETCEKDPHAIILRAGDNIVPGLLKKSVCSFHLACIIASESRVCKQPILKRHHASKMLPALQEAYDAIEQPTAFCEGLLLSSEENKELQKSYVEFRWLVQDFERKVNFLA